MRATIAVRKHAADPAVILCALRTEIGGQPSAKARMAVPFKGIEISAHWVKGSFMSTAVHRLVDDILSDFLQARLLQQLLQGGYIAVADRPRSEGGFVPLDYPLIWSA